MLPFRLVYLPCQERNCGRHYTITTSIRGPNEEFSSYEDMLQFYTTIGCKFKSEEFMLAWAHLSKGAVHGGAFTPFECPCCGYKPSAAQAKADLAAFEALTDEEQQERRRDHVWGGNHHHVHLYMGPLTKGLDMSRCGVDQLHL